MDREVRAIVAEARYSILVAVADKLGESSPKGMKFARSFGGWVRNGVYYHKRGEIKGKAISIILSDKSVSIPEMCTLFCFSHHAVRHMVPASNGRGWAIRFTDSMIYLNTNTCTPNAAREYAHQILAELF